MQNIDYIAIGKDAGCPFCHALGNKDYVPNERVRFLTGSCAGKEATVVEPPESLRGDTSIIVVQLDEDELSTQQMVNKNYEILERLPGMPIPVWAPPVSIRKTSYLHEHVLNFCRKNHIGTVSDVDWLPLYAMVWHIWDRRLPLSKVEVLDMMKAHGVPNEWRVKIEDILEHGLKLLTTMIGKKPIKKFLVPPMKVTLSEKYGFSE